MKSDEPNCPVPHEEDTDEELDEKYANIDVNFDESETEEEEEDVPRSPGIIHGKNRIHTDEILEDDLQDEFDCSFTEYENIPISRGKSFIQDDLMFAEPGMTVITMCSLISIRNNGENLFRY